MDDMGGVGGGGGSGGVGRVQKQPVAFRPYFGVDLESNPRELPDFSGFTFGFRVLQKLSS